MKERNYTREQITSAERFAFILGTLPQENRDAVVMMANAFISGMEAQQRIAAKPTKLTANRPGA